jgi:type II secretory ATPase GspE/PulE/Tfp pilus assembly ATPase PilB-like protein
MATDSSRVVTQNLGQVLLDAGLISEDQLQEAQQIQQAGRGSFGSVVAKRGWVSPQSLAMALSLHLNLPLIDLTRHSVQPEVLRQVPEDFARKHHLIPLDVLEDGLAVVMEDPTDIQVLEELTARSGMRILPMVGVRADILTAIDLNYKASHSIEASLAQLAPLAEEIQAPAGPRPIELTAEDPVVRSVDLLLEQAVRDGASDIHIEPARDAVIVRYRIDGLLQQVLSLPRGTLAPLLSRIKVLADMNIAETRRHQDGQFSVRFGDDEVFFRVATSETSWGEMAVLRVLGRHVAILDLPGLGMAPDTLAAFSRLIQAPFGMILASGPTGSGKTTTLYAALDRLDRRQLNIMTIEDPVEYDFPGISQIQVNRAADIHFASGLRAILRMDPDIILVGEIRDPETAATASQAALTGHLVLSSIHANDAPGALFRLANLSVERYMISSSVIGVLAQRLVRRVCEHCKTEAEPTPEERAAYREALGEELDRYLAGMGCNFCRHTGFRGRVGVFELLVMDDATQQLFLEGASSVELRAAVEAQGMTPMRRDGMLKVRMGITTPAEVLQRVFTVK